MHWPEGCGATFQDRNTWTVDPAPRVALPGLRAREITDVDYAPRPVPARRGARRPARAGGAPVLRRVRALRDARVAAVRDPRRARARRPGGAAAAPVTRSSRPRYVGVVKGPAAEGSYVVALESDVPHAESLSLDAADAGNELRFVNDFRGVGEAPNVSFQQATIRSAPAQMLVVTRPVPTGAEFLADYGEGYWLSTLGFVPAAAAPAPAASPEDSLPPAPAAPRPRAPSASSEDEAGVTAGLMMAGLHSSSDDDDGEPERTR